MIDVFRFSYGWMLSFAGCSHQCQSEAWAFDAGVPEVIEVLGTMVVDL